jgi:hypothetical protein
LVFLFKIVSLDPSRKRVVTCFQPYLLLAVLIIIVGN